MLRSNYAWVGTFLTIEPPSLTIIEEQGTASNLKVLITGGAGFIGTHLTRALLQRGHSVTVLDNFSPQIHGSNTELPADLRDDVRLVRGDVRDAGIWASTVPGHQAIVNLAAETGTGQSMYEVTRYEQVNVAGTSLLYDLLVKSPSHEVERIVVASSRAIYGEGAYDCQGHGLVYPGPRPSLDKMNGFYDPVCPICGGACNSVPTLESAPFQPSSFYGLTKQVQEQITLLFAQTMSISSIALRYQNVYGPGQSLKNPYTGILAIFSNQARANEPIYIFEDGMESRDFVYITDVVEATCRSIESSFQGSEVLNVGTGIPVSVSQVVDEVVHYFQSESHVSMPGSFREGDIRHACADTTRLQQVLNFVPTCEFALGIEKFLAWVTTQDLHQRDYERSLAEMRERGLLHD
jgi:dTDP-L-rhamnose 4-epimerase